MTRGRNENWQKWHGLCIYPILIIFIHILHDFCVHYETILITTVLNNISLKTIRQGLYFEPWKNLKKYKFIQIWWWICQTSKSDYTSLNYNCLESILLHLLRGSGYCWSKFFHFYYAPPTRPERPRRCPDRGNLRGALVLFQVKVSIVNLLI